MGVQEGQGTHPRTPQLPHLPQSLHHLGPSHLPSFLQPRASAERLGHPASFTPRTLLQGKQRGSLKLTGSPQFISGGAKPAPTCLLWALLWAGLGSSPPQAGPGCQWPPAQMPLQLLQPPPTPAGSLSHPLNFLNYLQEGFSAQEPGDQGGLGEADAV